MFKNLIIVSIILVVSSLNAQETPTKYNIDSYFVSEHPQSIRINFINQDENGFLWIATNTGLYKYDGYNFSSYLPSQHFQNQTSGNNIRTVLCEGKDRLWIGTQSDGLIFFDTSTERFSRFRNAEGNSLSILGKTVYSILDDQRGNKWVLTENGLDKIDKNFAVHHFIFSKVRQDKIVQNQSMILDSKGFLWISFHGTLYKFNIQTGILSTFHYQIPFRATVQCISSLGTKHLAVGTDGDGVYIINLQSNQCINLKRPNYYSNSSASNEIYSLGVDRWGNLWCGSQYGLHQEKRQQFFDKNQKKQMLSEANVLIDNTVTSIFEDRSAALWVGTNSGMLSKITFQNNLFTQYLPIDKKPNTLTDTKVNTFLQDKNGKMWIGTRKGVCWFNPDTKKFMPIPLTNTNQVKLNEVSSLFETNDETMLIGTWNRINAFSEYSYKKKQFSYYTFNDSELNMVGSAIKIKQNYYIATFGRGLLKIPQNLLNAQLSNYSKCTDRKLDIMYSQFCDSKRRIWLLGFQNGLGLMNSGTGKIQYFNNTKNPASLSDNTIHSIHEDAKGQIWIGTNNGLNLYKHATNTFLRFYPEKWTDNNKIIGVTSDKYGYLWIMQDHRIVRFNPNNGVFVFFNVQSWIPNCTFQSTAIGRDKNGMIYFGTKSNGFITISPDRIPKISKPSIAISGLLINNRRVLTGERLNGRVISSVNTLNGVELTYKQNTICIEFAALSYYNASENSYAYKLEGIQNEWVYTTAEHHSAIFSNLPSGKYIFRVKAANYLGVWDKSDKQLIITVAPPPWRTWWAIVSYLLFLAAIVAVIVNYNIKRLRIIQALEFERFEKEQIRLLNQQKMTFFTNVSHEFRTPLTLISTYNRKILDNVDNTQNIYPWVVNTQQNTDQLLLLVNQLLDFRKLEENQTRLQVTEQDIVKFSYSLFQLFTDLSHLKEIDYRFKSNCESALVWFDKQKLERILFNLLSNAFKFTSAGETIHISLTVQYLEKTNGWIILEVSDTGLGISVEEIQRIFDSFYQSAATMSDQSTGTGIGLAFVKQLVELHHGTITVESEKGKGSLFTVSLPACKESYDVQELSTPVRIEAATPPFLEEVLEIETKVSGTNDAPLILVVEDNAELRKLLVEDLLNEYRVLEACNGAEGLEMVWQHNPDLVISDVLMPEKDGFELCKELKNDLRSSHIPVVLLTAMAVDEKKLEGFRSGADDYIEKPFSTELFTLKIRNLLETRKHLQRVYSGDDRQAILELKLSPLDETFFQQARQTIEQNLANCNYDVDDFCREMDLGQKLVYRKIKSLTGLSISEYIRHERLKWAATLLHEQKYTVQEVSYKVGFATPSYFAKCFKKQFGIGPKDYT